LSDLLFQSTSMSRQPLVPEFVSMRPITQEPAGVLSFAISSDMANMALINGKNVIQEIDLTPFQCPQQRSPSPVPEPKPRTSIHFTMYETDDFDKQQTPPIPVWNPTPEVLLRAPSSRVMQAPTPVSRTSFSMPLGPLAPGVLVEDYDPMRGLTTMSEKNTTSATSVLQKISDSPSPGSSFLAQQHAQQQMLYEEEHGRPTISPVSASSSSHFSNTDSANQLNVTPAVRARTTATAIYPHPFMPFYLTGSLEGKISLWQYGNETPKATFGCSVQPGPEITRVRFNPNGTRFGAVDKAGTLALWHMPMTTAQFSPYSTITPFFRTCAHQKQANDFCFVNSASVVATCGLSPVTKRSVCLWDTLLPGPSSLVGCCTSPVFSKDAVATRIEFLTRSSEDIRVTSSDIFFVGDTAGSIHVLDLRNLSQVIQTVHSHNGAINSLVFDPSRRFLFSAAADGTTALWSLCRSETVDSVLTATSNDDDIPVLSNCLLKDVSVFGENVGTGKKRHKVHVSLFREKGASKSGITHVRVTQRRRCTCPYCTCAAPSTQPIIHPDHTTAIPYTEELVIYGAVGTDGQIVQSTLALH